MANTDKRVDELSNLSSLTGDELVLLQDPTTLEYGKTTLANVSAKSPVTSVAGKTGAVSLTKDDVGLSNVNDTSDADKTISTATQAALDTKATITALDAHTNSTANPHSVTKAQVGLGNVDNTSDANKPVSTAQQTALDLKANTSALAPVALSGAFPDLTGTPSIVNTLTGTANQVIASAASGNVTLSLPQDIGTGSSPTFSNAYLTNTLLANRTSPGIAFQALAGGTPDSTGGTGIIAGLAATSPITAAGQRIAYYGYRANSTNPALIAAYSTDSWTSGTGTYLNFELTPTGSNLRGPYAQLSSVGLALGPSATPTHTLTLNSTATGIALYNTVDQTTNYERFRGFMSGNVMNLVNETGGTGTMRNLFVGIGTGWGIGTTYSPGTATKITTSIATTALAGNIMVDSGTFTAASGTQTLKALLSTYNQTGTAGSTDLLISRTDTSLGTGEHNYIDLKSTLGSRFRIASDAQLYMTSPTAGDASIQVTQTATSSTANRMKIRHFALNSAAVSKEAFQLQSRLSTNTSGAEQSQVVMLGFVAGAQTTVFNIDGSTMFLQGNVGISPAAGITIGTATTQKLSFWNKTPVVQPSGTPAAATDLATALTLLNDLRTKLITVGLVA